MEKNTAVSLPFYTVREEVINSASHYAGALLGALFSVLCLVRFGAGAAAGRVMAALVFSSSVTITYAVSAVYHTLRPGAAKRIMRIVDHCTVFLLIAGSYTPFTLVSLSGEAVGIIVFAVVWGLAAIGAAINAINLEKFESASWFLYVALGWAVIVAYNRLVKVLSPAGASLLLWGGIAYTVGAFLYAAGAKRKYLHSVFHFLCLAGSALHFACIYLYVL